MNAIFAPFTASEDAFARLKFLALISYFIGATYLIPSSASVERFSFTYFALVLPAWLYVFLNWKWLFKGYTAPSICLAVFSAGAAIVALAQKNPSLAYQAFFISSISIVILNSKTYITPKELNVLFLLCVGGSAAVYWAGLTDYGFLPGQADAPACHQAMSFRVSLFRVPTESAILSLLVLITNVFFSQGVSRTLRLIVSGLALYFLLLSGIRTILLALVAVLPFLLYRGWTQIQPIRPNVAAAIVLGALGIAGALTLIGHHYRGGAAQFVQNYLFRTAICDAIFHEDEISRDPISKEGMAGGSLGSRWSLWSEKANSDSLGVSSAWLWRTVNRSCNVNYQLHLISQSPWTGNRSVIPQSEAQLIAVGCQPGTLIRYCEACTLPTYWLSKAGVAALPLLLSFITLLGIAAWRRDLFSVSCLLALGIISMGWGVSFTPYNFTLLLMMSVLAMSRNLSKNEIVAERSAAKISPVHELKGA